MTLNHVHSYERVGNVRSGKKWRCSHPDCTHLIDRELVAGKRSLCTCGATFILDPEAMQRKSPKCLLCRNTEDGRQAQRVHKALSKVMFGSPDGEREGEI